MTGVSSGMLEWRSSFFVRGARHLRLPLPRRRFPIFGGVGGGVGGWGAGREGSYCLERNGRPRCLYEPAVHPVKRVVDQRPLIESGFQRAARNGIGWRFSVKVIVAARAASFLPTQLVIIVADSRSSSRIEFLKLNCFYDNLFLT